MGRCDNISEGNIKELIQCNSCNEQSWRLSACHEMCSFSGFREVAHPQKCDT